MTNETRQQLAATFERDSLRWVASGHAADFCYNWTWLGVPFVQLPADVIRLQQIIFAHKPDVIVETGTKHGGSAVFFASMLKMVGQDHGKVISVDINKPEKDEALPHRESITFVTGNSVAPNVLKQVKELIPEGAKVMVFLDSSHMADHVEKELAYYSAFVTPRQFLIVADGFMEDQSGKNLPKAWQQMNPAIAARKFVASDPAFVERKPDKHYYVTYCKDGFLERVK